MKKITLSFFLLASFSTLLAQTIVSTAPQNRKVILEEFTGINCVYCPQGHSIANTLKAANPNNFFAINVHVGGYATPGPGQPDFRTPFGSAIAGQTGLTGYPSGTVNRSVFTGAMTAGGTALPRNLWTARTNATLAQASYVNVGTTASIDPITRVLTVNVEAYYTANSPVSTNKLNVAFLQNNTKGPQTGGNAGTDYAHQHRLISMLTGQWGENITTTTTGSLISRSYTYTIPAAYNNIIAEMGDFEIVAFVTETQQNIVSGNGTTPTYTGLANNDALIKRVINIPSQCKNTVTPQIEIQNYGQNNITNLAINYDLNALGQQVYNWTGNLNTMGKTIVTLPEITYSVQDTNLIVVAVQADDNPTNNFGEIAYDRAVGSSSELTLELTTDIYGSEITWNFKNSSGVIVQSGGPYTDGTVQQFSIPVSLPTNDCYSFNLIDSYGDGGGLTTVTDSNDVSVISTPGTYGTGLSVNFSTTNALANNVFNTKAISIYPNPSYGILNIATEEIVNVNITDLLGKSVFQMKNVDNTQTLNLTNLAKGIYLVKVSNENVNYTEKIILK